MTRFNVESISKLFEENNDDIWWQRENSPWIQRYLQNLHDHTKGGESDAIPRQMEGVIFSTVTMMSLLRAFLNPETLDSIFLLQ
jgi:hypothetical protein